MNKIVMVIMELLLASVVWKVSSVLFYTPVSSIISFVENSKTVCFKYKSRKVWDKLSVHLCKIVLVGNIVIFFLIMSTPFVKAAFEFITNYFS